jgi:hypothetical protein
MLPCESRLPGPPIDDGSTIAAIGAGTYRKARAMNVRHVHTRATVLGVVVAIGCHTVQGVKQDTKSALDASGKALEKAATKIDGHKPNRREKPPEKHAQTPALRRAQALEGAGT